jgi:hypothetical protein
MDEQETIIMAAKKAGKNHRPKEERRREDRRIEARRAVDRIRGLHCWEYHNCKLSDCIVQRCEAQKCWLLRGHEEFKGEGACDECNYKLAWDIGIFIS